MLRFQTKIVSIPKTIVDFLNHNDSGTEINSDLLEHDINVIVPTIIKYISACNHWLNGVRVVKFVHINIIYFQITQLKIKDIRLLGKLKYGPKMDIFVDQVWIHLLFISVSFVKYSNLSKYKTCK